MHTESVPIAVFMLVVRWSMRGQSKLISCHIGIDLLGSDLPPSALLETVLAYSKELKQSVHLTLFGTSALFKDAPPPGAQILYHVTEDVITMDDAPLSAIRRKQGSSLCTGIRMLQEGHLQAFISAGNTGALIACAKIKLKNLPHVERPALMTLLPTRGGAIAVLDVGANTSYKASHLVQFAAMGIAYQKSRGILLPRVGLLNIGTEAKKGTPELQLAYNTLLHASKCHSSPFVFAGNIEGRDVFHSELDVLVTDGFTGNVFLKTAEGMAAVILEELQNTTLEGCSPHIKKVMGDMRHRLHYAEYPGAILCGVDGIILKCHGNSSPQSFTSSIETASRLVQHAFLEHVKKELISKKS